MTRVSKVYHPLGESDRNHNLTLVCCYPVCEAPVTQKVSQPLCDKHLISVFRAVSDLAKQIDPKSDVVASPRVMRDRNPYAPVGKVYFMRFGDRIKIGFTTNLHKRLQHVPNDELLASMPGSRHTETKMHKQFAHLRIVGEWFSMGPDLLEFIEGLKKAA